MVLGIDDMDFGRERSLVERVQLGDEEAFAELYRRHHQRLYRYCLYRLGEAHEAQDVVQESFTRAWANAQRIQGDLRFYPWLRTIAGNLCTDVGRRRSRVQPEAAVDSGSVDGGQESRLDKEVDLALLEQAMARLPERHRQVLVMREAAGLSYEQLADETGTTVGSVESLLWRARQGLKRQFAVVSGEGMLAGVPLLGWIIRRAHGAHSRIAARIAATDSNYLSALGGAVGSVAVGSAVAVALVVSGAGGPGPTGAPTVRTAAPAPAAQTVQAVLQLAGQPAPAPASPPSPSGPTGATPRVTSGGVPRTSGSRLVNPIQTENSAAARREAEQDPVHVTVGAVTAGVNPQAALQYVTGLAPAHLQVP